MRLGGRSSVRNVRGRPKALTPTLSRVRKWAGVRAFAQRKAPREAGPQGVMRRDYFVDSPFACTSTRRLGARHSTSALKFFWSHCTTGCFMPRPMVSIFALSMPLPTR